MDRDSALKEAKQSKKPNINRILKKYNVPRSTLQDSISGRVTHGTKPRPRPYLTAEEEKSLTTHLIDAAKLGYGKTRKKVAENVAREKRLFVKKKYPMDGGEGLLSDSHNFPYVTGRFHSSCLYRCHQSGIYFTILESTLKKQEHEL